MIPRFLNQARNFASFSIDRLNLRQKIFWGVAVLMVLGIILSASFYSALVTTDSALHRVTNEEEPISATAYEMAINVANSGSTVINYLRTGDAYYQKAALDEKLAFTKVLERYSQIANNTQERELADQVSILHAEYWELGEELMRGRPEQELKTALTTEHLELTEDVLDEAVAKVGANEWSADRRLMLQNMQLSLSKISKDLQVYMRLGLVQSSQVIEDEAEQFLVQLGYYQALGLGRVESARAQRLSTLFDQSHVLVKETIQVHDTTETKIQALYDLREVLNDLVSGKMLPVAKQDLERAKLAAEEATYGAKFWASVVAPLILALSSLLVWVLTRSITRPAKQLLAGATAIGDGDLDYRIPNLGDDELGVIGRQFNHMAEKLEKTTVSRNRLEDSEAALRLSQDRYARALSGTNDGIFDCDLQSKEVYYSERWKNMLGYSDAEFGNTLDSYFEVVHPDDVELLRHNFDAYVERPGEYLQNEHRVKHKDGEYRWVLCRAVATSDEGHTQPTRLSGSQTDIHAQKLAEQQLIHDAMHDQLTSLPNRHLLLDRLQHFLDNKERREHEIAGLLFLDLDGFKLVNDSLGHAAGDRLLIALAHRLQKFLKPSDTLARFGGDEFVILREGLLHARDIDPLAEQVHEALELPFVTGNGKTFLGASIGIVLTSEEYKRADDMLRDADIAMYRAKTQGKKQHVMFDQDMHGDVVERMLLDTDLRIALEKEQLEIYYQPIIDLQESRKLVGFEALLRWDHPVRGSISPEVFVPLLEDNGLIIEVGEWLLAKACRTVKAWHRKNYTPWVSVNVSAIQLRDGGLITGVAKALEDSQLAPKYLTLEITESNVMKNETLARGLLKKLKEMGVKLSMDDFGVGYSSLSYLKRFPWDYVKIDRSFVNDIAHDPEAASIIEAIIVMVHSLKFDVVAEGIETVEQLEVLRDYGIDCVQGFLLSHPERSQKWDGLTSISSKRFLKQAFEGKASILEFLNLAKRKGFKIILNPDVFCCSLLLVLFFNFICIMYSKG